MRIAFGSDLSCELTTAIAAFLHGRGDEIMLCGALCEGADASWPAVGAAVGTAVANGIAEHGIVCCWTGTGVSIAANKVLGVRAALCGDAATASGAREWNDANVLALSIRATTPAIAREILTAWFAGRPTADPSARAMIEAVVTPDNVG